MGSIVKPVPSYYQSWPSKKQLLLVLAPVTPKYFLELIHKENLQLNSFFDNILDSTAVFLWEK